MAISREPKVEQPSLESQRTYASIRDNDATLVGIVGTRKRYKIRWLKNGQIDKLSRLLIRKRKYDNEDEKSGDEDILSAVLMDAKLACKAAAIIILDGYWKLKFRYWYLWRWFYYVRQYDNVQLQGILDEGKKKIPVAQIVSIYELLRNIRSNWAWEDGLKGQ